MSLETLMSPARTQTFITWLFNVSQMFANVSIIVFNEHLFDVCKDSSKCQKPLCLAGMVRREMILPAVLVGYLVLLQQTLLKVDTLFIVADTSI